MSHLPHAPRIQPHHNYVKSILKCSAVWHACLHCLGTIALHVKVTVEMHASRCIHLQSNSVVYNLHLCIDVELAHIVGRCSLLDAAIQQEAARMEDAQLAESCIRGKAAV